MGALMSRKRAFNWLVQHALPHEPKSDTDLQVHLSRCRIMHGALWLRCICLQLRPRVQELGGMDEQTKRKYNWFH